MRQGPLRVSAASSASSSPNRFRSCSPPKLSCSKPSEVTEDDPSVSEAVHRNVLDHALIEPDIMVGAGIRGVGKNGAAPSGIWVKRSDHPYGAAAAMPPDPARDRYAVAVTERMHDRRHPRQVPSPDREAVIEPVSPGRSRDHQRTLLGVARPAFDQFPQSHDPAATVIVGQQRREINCTQRRMSFADGREPSTASRQRSDTRVRHLASVYPLQHSIAGGARKRHILSLRGSETEVGLPRCSVAGRRAARSRR